MHCGYGLRTYNSQNRKCTESRAEPELPAGKVFLLPFHVPIIAHNRSTDNQLNPETIVGHLNFRLLSIVGRKPTTPRLASFTLKPVSASALYALKQQKSNVLPKSFGFLRLATSWIRKLEHVVVEKIKEAWG